MNSRFFKIFYKIHTYVGIFVALHLVVLILTGTVLILKDEIEGNSGDESAHETMDLPSLDVHVQNLLAKYKDDRPLAFSIEESNPDIAQLRMGLQGSKLFRESRRVYFNIHTGEEVSAPKKTGSVMDFVLRLHREFLLGSNGKIYVGFIGLLYAFTLISGFFIYGNFSKKTSFGEIRRATTRTTFGDLHRFIGMTVFAWGLLIAITGLFLGLSSTLIKVFQYSELQKLNAQYSSSSTQSLPSFDKVLQSAKKALPETSFDYLAFPDTQFSPPGHFLVLMHGNTPWTERLVELVVVDGATGELTEVRSLPWYLKVAMLSEPLHFGNYGGLFLKVLWLVLSLASLVLPVTGTYIWWSRRNKTPVSLENRKATLRPWDSDIFKKIYFVPGVLGIVCLSAVIGSFLIHGLVNIAFVALLLIPVYFIGHLFIVWIKKGLS